MKCPKCNTTSCEAIDVEPDCDYEDYQCENGHYFRLETVATVYNIMEMWDE